MVLGGEKEKVVLGGEKEKVVLGGGQGGTKSGKRRSRIDEDCLSFKFTENEMSTTGFGSDLTFILLL